MSFTKKPFTQELSTSLYDSTIQRNIKALIEKRNFNDEYANFTRNFLQELLIKTRTHWAPHVNGWYYCNMIGGTWEQQVIDISNDPNNEFKEFSPGAGTIIPRAKKEFGHLIKDVDGVQLGMDYEGVSGRLRTISIATRTNISTEFTLSWKENMSADVFKYHNYWYNYIEASKKGFITNSVVAYNQEGYFIEIPYYNALWVAILKPFTYELQGLIKFMGIAPTGLPLQNLLGQRGVSQATTYNINYKVIDIIVQMYDEQKPSGNFYDEFIDSQKAFFLT